MAARRKSLEPTHGSPMPQTGRPRMEAMLTARKGFGLETATPLQRAICRVSEGLPLEELWEHDEVRDAFGGVRPPEEPPAVMGVFCAIRSGKSKLAALRVVIAAITCDLSRLSPGDLVEVPVLAPRTDRAQAVFSHLRDNIQGSPALAQLLIGEPTADTLWLRHPTGKAIRVKVTALSKGGANVVGSWLAGAVFDEAPRMAGEQDGVINLTDSLRAIRGRMLPGAQIWLIGSPYAPFGPVYDLDQDRFGKPGRDVVVIRAPGPAMNPVHWTPEECERLREADPQAYRTDVLALYADPEESLFSSVEVEGATRKGERFNEHDDIPPVPGGRYAAAMDPATRGNAWTLVLLECTGRGGPGGITPTYRVVLTREWIGSKAKPLSPNRVLQEIAGLCAAYGVTMVTTDQHALDALRDLAEPHGLSLVGITIDASNRLEMAKKAAFQVSLGVVELPRNRTFRADLLAAKKRVTQNGVTLVLPRSGDGRHCDFLPPFSMLLTHTPDVPDGEAPTVADDDFAWADTEPASSFEQWSEVVQGLCA